MSTFYEVLGVGQDASPDEVKRAYRAIMKANHPDVTGNDPVAAQRATDATVAYATLSDTDLREKYDRSLVEPEPAPDVPFEDSWGEQVEPETMAEPEPEPEPVEEVIDDDIYIDDTVWDEPRPAPVTGPAWLPAEVGPTRIVSVPPLREPLLVTVGTVAVALVVALISARGVVDSHLMPDPSSAAALPPAVTLAGIVAGCWLGTRTSKGSPAPTRRSLTTSWIITGAMMLGTLLFMAILPPFTLIACAVLGLASAWLPVARTLAVRHWAKELNQVVPRRSLVEADRFGGLPGGVAADQADLALRELHRLPAVRILMCDNPNAWFSHAVLLGHRVVLVGALVGPPASYRWSGPTLLAETGHGLPVEVLSSGDALGPLLDRIGNDVGEFAAVLAVVPTDDGDFDGVAPTPSTPAVLPVSRLADFTGAFLCAPGNDVDVVDQGLVVRTWQVLSS